MLPPEKPRSRMTFARNRSPGDVMSLTVVCLSLLFVPMGHEAATVSQVIMEEFTVPSSDARASLYVRNKHPAELNSFRGDKIVLFVHGATYPAETSFDLPLDGWSWMDDISLRGYDVYLIYVRGYGKSSARRGGGRAPPARPSRRRRSRLRRFFGATSIGLSNPRQIPHAEPRRRGGADQAFGSLVRGHQRHQTRQLVDVCTAGLRQNGAALGRRQRQAIDEQPLIVRRACAHGRTGFPLALAPHTAVRRLLSGACQPSEVE
jgi:hypothetical protein